MDNSMRDTFFKSVVARQCVILRMKKYELADKIGMPHSTFYLKLSHPGQFTVDEMRNLCAVLHFSVEDKTSII